MVKSQPFFYTLEEEREHGRIALEEEPVAARSRARLQRRSFSPFPRESEKFFPREKILFSSFFSFSSLPVCPISSLLAGLDTELPQVLYRYQLRYERLPKIVGVFCTLKEEAEC